MSVQSVCSEAITEDPPRVVRMEYEKKSTGEIKTYYVEPYEIRDGKFWAEDRIAGHIKQFILGNIINVDLTDETFSPKWPFKGI